MYPIDFVFDVAYPPASDAYGHYCWYATDPFDAYDLDIKSFMSRSAEEQEATIEKWKMLQ